MRVVTTPELAKKFLQDLVDKKLPKLPEDKVSEPPGQNQHFLDKLLSPVLVPAVVN